MWSKEAMKTGKKGSAPTSPPRASCPLSSWMKKSSYLELFLFLSMSERWRLMWGMQWLPTITL